MLTINDIAEIAGVSTATVSRVLNNSALVRKETRERVLKIIETMNYRPNSAGRSLRMNKAHLVMVTLPDITNTFFSRVVRSIESTAQDNGFDVLIFETLSASRSMNQIREFVTSRKVDGVIHLSARTELSDLSFLSETPTVLACEYMENIDVPSVSIDNVAAARDAVDYLISLGHRQIAFLNGPSNVVLCRDRYKGFREALAYTSLDCGEPVVLDGDFSTRSGYDAVKMSLSDGIHFTALFCANDAMAIGAMNAIHDLGYSVPGDISVIGFDDIEFSAFSRPTLTTITQPVDELGRKAMQMWLDIFEGQETERLTKLPHKLTVRQSCASPKH